MSTVGVVVPSWHYWANPLKLQPLWELYYATLIAERFRDATVDLIDLRDPAARSSGPELPARDVYVYWIMKSADAEEVYALVRAQRARTPGAIHVAGGNHVDHHVEQTAAVFDAVVLGTAEELIVQALADHRAGRLAPIYRADTGYHFAHYGHARRDFLPPDRIVNREHFLAYGAVPGTGVYFSRGCSFTCRFCVYNNPAKFEYRLPAQITAEIEYLKSAYGVRGVNLRDEVCLPTNARVARGYLEAIGKGGVIWRGQTVPIASEEIVWLARASGCQELALGLESVESDAVLQIANKPSKSIEQNRRFIALLKKHDIRVKVCLILGLPGESDRVLDRTIAFLEDVRPDYVAVSGFDPVPGSPFFRDAARYGIRTIDPDLRKHAHLVYRFGEDEDVGLPFEYEERTPFGPGRRRDAIIADIKSLQGYLRERGMSY